MATIASGHAIAIIARIVAGLTAARPVHLAILDGVKTMAGVRTPDPWCTPVQTGVSMAGTNVANTAGLTRRRDRHPRCPLHHTPGGAQMEIEPMPSSVKSAAPSTSRRVQTTVERTKSGLVLAVSRVQRPVRGEGSQPAGRPNPSA
jgi:hypothetical protein